MLKNKIQIKENSFDDQLRQTFIDFLNGDRSTRIYDFLYQDDLKSINVPDKSGITGWDKALNDDNHYYIYNNEVDLIKRVSNQIENKVPYKGTLIELGIGSQKAVTHKTIPLIEALKPQHFIANDLSYQATQSARAVLQKNYPSLKIEDSTENFLDISSNLFKVHDVNVVMTGSTISNITMYDGHIPTNALISYLKTIAHFIGKTGTLIITQDTNQDEFSLKKAYATPELIQFRIDMLYRLISYLNVEGFDPSTLVYEPIWEPDCHLLTNTFVTTKNQEISVAGNKLSLSAGQRLYVSNCYKYPAKSFLHMASIAGLYPIFSENDSQEKVVLHALRNRV